MKREKELNNQIQVLKDKIHKLHCKEGKSEIMKQMLGASEAGQKLLEQIKGFNKSVSSKLLR